MLRLTKRECLNRRHRRALQRLIHCSTDIDAQIACVNRQLWHEQQWLRRHARPANR
jgi:hypothetical protein